MAFCPNCGHRISDDYTPNNNFTVSQSGSTLGLSTVDDRPEGLDWLAIVIAGITIFEFASLAWSLSFVLGIMFLVLLIHKKEIVVDALWHRNIFKPFMIHFAWGFVAMEFSIILFSQIMRSNSIFLLPVVFLFLNAVYYVGYRIICHFYAESKPQGQLVRMLVTMGLLLFYLAARRDKKATDSLFANDSVAMTGPAPDMTSASVAPSAVAGMDSVNTFNQQSMPSMDFNAQPQIDTTMAPANTTLNITDSLSQPAGSVEIHSDGSADLFDASMQSAGHITSSGAILDALNMPSGRIDGNTIFDANNQVAYTIEGDTFFDKLHQPSYTIRDGQIFDKLNQLVGSIK